MVNHAITIRNTHKMELKIRMVRKHPVTVIAPKSITTMEITCF